MSTFREVPYRAVPYRTVPYRSNTRNAAGGFRIEDIIEIKIY